MFVLETPCCAQEGVIFDLVNLVPFIRKYKANPVTGEEMSTKDIIRLNMVLSIYNHVKEFTGTLLHPLYWYRRKTRMVFGTALSCAKSSRTTHM